MPIPLALAAPAAVAGLAYLNAKGSLWYDALLFRSIGPAVVALLRRQRSQRLNYLYVLEAKAQSKEFAGRTFLIFEGKSYTYAQTYDLVLRYGAWLRERHGIRPKDIVAMDMHNSDLFVFCWLGLWSIGAKPAFINYNLKGPALKHCVGASGAKLMLVDSEVASMVSEDLRRDLASVTVIAMTPEAQAEVSRVEPLRRPDSELDEDKGQNMAMLIYTSGTTGLPKAAIVSWAKCLVGAIITSRWTGESIDTILYTAMPLYHSSAAILGFLGILESGGTIAIGRKFSTKTFWRDVRETKANKIQYVGETCRYLLAAPPETDPVTGESLDRRHGVKLAFGNGLRPDVWDRFKDRFGIDAIGEFYAATEGSMGSWNLSRNDFARGAIGRFGWLSLFATGARGLHAAVIEVDHATASPVRDPATGFCRPVAPGTPGELISRLPAADVASRFQGYYGDAAASAARVLRDVFRPGDAYLRTGDAVRWDADGRVFFVDRLGDTFRWRGENVSTAEVAAALGAHPRVREANVYGVEVPCHDGRAGCAAVALDGRADAGTLRDLAALVGRALPRYARPLFLRVVPRTGLQVTGTNKQQKHQLRSEGVRPDAVGEDKLYWLQGDTYVPFRKRDWDELSGGRAKL